ncbi:RIP metalloprotease RseP [Desulfovibrio sp. PG-178-WT-4]|uniref:Zinc metalloprotease n=1 Tax=Desulfovibrio porci TaxID=2605782 RepID=A0A6L5XM76_9BACT|nr:RIP metalloprotease RseP [Desulfovibrio porci]MDY3809508.1 RIP metalloprotease RseP [Desulfovibrio porci]MSS28235.1 RIP metalloprotease RseP [Desulfovibrio porci]
MLTTIIAVIIVLGGLIFFHELGHFAVARALGMGVSTFSLGFGPKILKYKRGKTEYALSLVPLGGYVALVGESDEADIPEGFSKEESFALRPAWQRLLVVAAGPTANIVLAWLLCWGLAFGWGTPVLLPQVGAVTENSPAARAGLRPGDRILSVNGQTVESWEAMSDAIARSDGRPMRLEVERVAPGAAVQTPPDADDRRGQDLTANDRLALELTAERATRKTIFGENETAWLIGVRAAGSVATHPESFWNAASAGADQTWRMVSLTWQSFVKLAERVVPLDQVGGPIMIAQMVGEQAHQGLAGLLALTALISVNLGILNLLPIPILDGGQVVFCLLEILFRRPVNRKVQEYAMRVGLALLIGLMLLATFNDVWRLLKS